MNIQTKEATFEHQLKNAITKMIAGSPTDSETLEDLMAKQTETCGI